MLQTSDETKKSIEKELQTSNEVKQSIDLAIENIKKEMPACQIVKVSSWHLPVFKQRVTYTVTRDREMTVLEEFIMKAATIEVSEGISIALIAHLLQMDEIFVKACVEGLVKKAMLENAVLPIVKLTEIGLKHFERGMIPEKAVAQEIEFYTERKFGVVYAKIVQEASYGIYDKFELINDSITDIKKDVNRSFIINIGKEQGKVIEEPKIGQYISSITSLETLEKSQTLMSEIWIKNADVDREFYRVWDHSKEVFRPEVAELI